MKGHQYEQGGTLDIWETLNVECNHRAKRRWKNYQLLRDKEQRKITIQDEMWILFINVPMRSGGGDQHGREISTKLLRSIEEAIYNPPPMQRKG